MDEDVDAKRVAPESLIEGYVSRWNDENPDMPMHIDKIEYSDTDNLGRKSDDGSEFAQVSMSCDGKHETHTDDMTFNVMDTEFTVNERMQDFGDMAKDKADTDDEPDDDDTSTFRM